MKILKQKNVYSVDLVNKKYEGYIETYLNTQIDTAIRYNFSSLEILDVSIYMDNIFIYPQITVEYLKDKIENKKNFLNCDSDFLNIKLSEEYKNKDLKIKIEFLCLETNLCINFYKQVLNSDKHKEIIGINNLKKSNGLFPSINVIQSYKWELCYITQSFEELKIVSPGFLTNYEEDNNLIICTYQVKESVPENIGFAIGTYERSEIFSGDDKKVILCSRMQNINELVEDFNNIIKYIEYILQIDYPVNILNVLFTNLEIDKLFCLGICAYNISVLSINDIEPNFISKKIVAESILSQIFYFYLEFRDLTDKWIFCGLKGYLEDCSIRLLLGNNDFLYNYKIDKDFVLQNDIYELPLCDNRRKPESYDSDFYIKKCKLVFHTLENNLSKAFIDKICQYVIIHKKEIKNNYTGDFLLLIKDITGKDMKDFFEFYIFKPGLIKLQYKFYIDTKKNRVDFDIKQEGTSKLVNSNKIIKGNISIMSYEVEGCFEHSFDLSQKNHFYYHIRTKKKKKTEEEEDEVMPLLWMRIDPKREHLANGIIEQPDYMFIEQALDKNVIGQIEALDHLIKHPSSQICEVFERILDNSHMFYKIRIKVIYLISKINIESYIGYQRLIQFYSKKYFIQSSTIVKPNDFVFVNYFIQKHIIKALCLSDLFWCKKHNGRNVISASVIYSFIFNILKFNDNSGNSYSDSYLISSVIESFSNPVLALYCLSTGGTLKVHDTYNEFSTEKYYSGTSYDDTSDDCNRSDNHMNYDRNGNIDNHIDDRSNEENIPLDYTPHSPTQRYNEGSDYDLKDILDEEEEIMEEEEIKVKDLFYYEEYINKGIKEVERYRTLDLIFPSHGNIITESCLYFYGRLAIYGIIGLNKEILVNLSKYPNTTKIRKASLSLLLILYYQDDEVIFHITDVIEKENIYWKLYVVHKCIKLFSLNPNTKIKFKEKIEYFRNLILKFPYNYEFKRKIQIILSYFEDKELDQDTFYNKMIDYFKKKYNKSFFNKKLKPSCSFDESRILRIKFKDFTRMKRQLLEDYCILNIRILEKKEEENKKEVRFINKSVILNKQEEEVIEEMGSKIEDINLEEMLYEDNLTSGQIENERIEKERLNEAKRLEMERIKEESERLENERVRNKIEKDISLIGLCEVVINNIPSNTLSPDNIDENSNINETSIYNEEISEPTQTLINLLGDTSNIDKIDNELYNTFTEIDTKTYELPTDQITSKKVFSDQTSFEEIFSKNNLFSKGMNLFTTQNQDESRHDLFIKQSTLQYTNILEDYLDNDIEYIEGVSYNNSYNNSNISNINNINYSPDIHYTDLEKFLDIGSNNVYLKEKGVIRFIINYKIKISIKKITKKKYIMNTPSKKLYFGFIKNMPIRQLNKLILKYKENKFFDWEPKTFKEIEYELDKLEYKILLKEIERSLVFVLSYSQYNGRSYNITKRLFDTFEKQKYDLYIIPNTCIIMNNKIRNYCIEFLNSLFLNTKFIGFIKPVNTEYMETYLDIVRSPMCLEVIRSKMMKYITLESFYGDLRQIYKNCLFFNKRNSEISHCAKYFIKKIKLFDQCIRKEFNIKFIDSKEVIRRFLLRFQDSINFRDLYYKSDTLKLSEIIKGVRDIKSQDMIQYISSYELRQEISEFEGDVYHAFSVHHGKVYCYGLSDIEEVEI